MSIRLTSVLFSTHSTGHELCFCTLEGLDALSSLAVPDPVLRNTEEAKQMRVKYALSGLGMPSQLLWFRVRERLPDDEP